jgi:hypothetical protein
LFNSEFVAETAIDFSEWVHKDGASVNDDVVNAYHCIFHRKPTATELQLAGQVVEEHGLPTLARVLFNTNEFLMLP